MVLRLKARQEGNGLNTGLASNACVVAGGFFVLAKLKLGTAAASDKRDRSNSRGKQASKLIEDYSWCTGRIRSYDTVWAFHHNIFEKKSAAQTSFQLGPAYLVPIASKGSFFMVANARNTRD